MFIAGVLVLLLVKENFVPHIIKTNHHKFTVFAKLSQPEIIIAMFLTAMLVQAATKSINPVISLFVRQLMHHHGNISFVSGIITALPGLATIMTAGYLGNLGDRIGARRVLIGGLLFLQCGLFLN